MSISPGLKFCLQNIIVDAKSCICLLVPFPAASALTGCLVVVGLVNRDCIFTAIKKVNQFNLFVFASSNYWEVISRASVSFSPWLHYWLQHQIILGLSGKFKLLAELGLTCSHFCTHTYQIQKITPFDKILKYSNYLIAKEKAKYVKINQLYRFDRWFLVGW